MAPQAAPIGHLFVPRRGPGCAPPPVCAEPCARSTCCSFDGISLIGALAEFLGTLFVVLFSVGAIAMWIFNSNERECCSGPEIPLAIGLAYAAACYAFAKYSGGHFNPAYTLASLIARRLSIIQAVVYWVAQLLGAVTAGALLLLFVNAYDPTLGSPRLLGGFSDGKAFFLEALATMFLTLFLLLTSKCTHGCSYTRAVVYGVTVAAIAYFTFVLTGAVFSPWRYLGVAIFSGNWVSAWVFSIAGFVGSIAGALIYMIFANTKYAIDAEHGAARVAAA